MHLNCFGKPSLAVSLPNVRLPYNWEENFCWKTSFVWDQNIRLLRTHSCVDGRAFPKIDWSSGVDPPHLSFRARRKKNTTADTAIDNMSRELQTLFLLPVGNFLWRSTQAGVNGRIALARFSRPPHYSFPQWAVPNDFYIEWRYVEPRVSTSRNSTGPSAGIESTS